MYIYVCCSYLWYGLVGICFPLFSKTKRLNLVCCFQGSFGYYHAEHKYKPTAKSFIFVIWPTIRINQPQMITSAENYLPKYLTQKAHFAPKCVCSKKQKQKLQYDCNSFSYFRRFVAFFSCFNVKLTLPLHYFYRAFSSFLKQEKHFYILKVFSTGLE